MLNLEKEETEILADLFKFQDAAQDVDAARFRVRHEGRFKTIDLLKTTGLIRESTGRYRLTIFGLQHIDSPEALEVLNAAESLYHELQVHYRCAIHEQIAVEELAKRAKINHHLAQVTLHFMTDVPWCSGWSHGFPNAPNATVGASEKVLDHATFAIALQKIAEWAVTRPQNSVGVVPPVRAVEVRRDYRQERLAWHQQLPFPFPSILAEIYESRDAGHVTLPTLGVRTILDLVCSRVAGDTGTFQAKLADAKRNGYMNDAECEVFRIAFDAGSAAAHRGHVTDVDSRDQLLEIMEHILASKFRIGGIAEKVKAGTPQRQLKNGK